MKSLLLMALALLPASKTLAQTNAQVFYDFGSDRKFVTLTAPCEQNFSTDQRPSFLRLRQ